MRLRGPATMAGWTRGPHAGPAHLLAFCEGRCCAKAPVMMHRELQYLIAVDGGGSGCRAVVADATGQLLGQGVAGPANATTDLEQAVANCRAAINAAQKSAGLRSDSLSHARAHLGMAGALTREVTQRVADGIGITAVTVSDDLATTVAGALGARDGVVITVGTGSVMAALRGGVLHRVGGWGMQVSDQASGAWLGRSLLERVLLCHDGLEDHGALTLETFEALDEDPMNVVRYARTARPSDYALFAPNVLAAARTGDATAEALMRDGASYLLRGIGVLERDVSEVLCLTGGIGPAYAPYLPEEVQARLAPPEGSALDGALSLARQSFVP